MVEQTLVRDRDHVLEMLKEVETNGGEGLMLRKPGSYVQFDPMAVVGKTDLNG